MKSCWRRAQLLNTVLSQLIDFLSPYQNKKQHRNEIEIDNKTHSHLVSHP